MGDDGSPGEAAFRRELERIEAAEVKEVPAAEDWTLDQLSNAAKSGCLILAIHGRVFDLSTFAESHPGGAGTLEAHAGTDATHAFETIHQIELLNTFKEFDIGSLVRDNTDGDGQGDDGGDSDNAEGTRMSLIVDGGPDSGLGGSHNTVRCTAAELRALPNVHTIAAESVKRGAPSLVAGYVNYGAEDEQSLHRNRSSFSRYTLVPRVLRDVAVVDTSVTLCRGRLQARSPIGIAPFAGSSIMHPDGELALARAAATSGTLYVVPFYCGYPIEDVRAAGEAAKAGAQLLLQLYPPRLPGRGEVSDGGLDRMYMTKAIRHAALNGYAGVVVTVDTVNNGNREKSYKNVDWIAQIKEECGSFPTTRGLENAGVGRNRGHTARLNWDDIKWFVTECRSQSVLLVVKGIMAAADAAIAAELGVDAVQISNHGGRQLDGTDGPIECVKECVTAVAGRCDVFFDSGVRRGKDAFKALALGANAIFVGRPALWGLNVGGDAGVSRVLSILNEELVSTMQLCGCTTIDSINLGHVRDTDRCDCTQPAADTGRHTVEMAIFAAATAALSAIISAAATWAALTRRIRPR